MPGKDGGRRVQEQGNRGEAGWAGGRVVVRGDQEIVGVFEPDLEPDRVVGTVEVMRGSAGRWVKMISGVQPPANQKH